MSAAVNKKLKFMINANVGDDEVSEEKKNVPKSQLTILHEKTRKFTHHAKQFRNMQKMNKLSDQTIFAVNKNKIKKTFLNFFHFFSIESRKY